MERFSSCDWWEDASNSVEEWWGPKVRKDQWGGLMGGPMGKINRGDQEWGPTIRAAVHTASVPGWELHGCISSILELGLFRVTTILKGQMANYVQCVLSYISTLCTLMWHANILFSLATCPCLAGGRWVVLIWETHASSCSFSSHSPPGLWVWEWRLDHIEGIK